MLICPGYFGSVPGSLLSQVGRGYTDLCAALCAVGLSAVELQVWKEVDGIFTADPRKVPSARLVPVITPDEAAELTYYGSEVIHPFTMEQVIRAKIPIRIKNVGNPAGYGTVIYPDESFPLGLESCLPSHEEGEREEGRMPTAVTIKDSIIVLNIHSNRKTISHGFLARIFGTLDRAGVVVDLISTSEVHVSPLFASPWFPYSLPRFSAVLVLMNVCCVTGVHGDARLPQQEATRPPRPRPRADRRHHRLPRHGDPLSRWAKYAERNR